MMVCSDTVGLAFGLHLPALRRAIARALIRALPEPLIPLYLPVPSSSVNFDVSENVSRQVFWFRFSLRCCGGKLWLILKVPPVSLTVSTLLPDVSVPLAVNTP